MVVKLLRIDIESLNWIKGLKQENKNIIMLYTLYTH